MLIPDNPSGWIETGAGYLEFVSAVAWLVCAILAAAFWAPRAPAPTERRHLPASLAAALGFSFLALAAVEVVLQRHGRNLPGLEPWDAAATVGKTIGAVILMGVAPLPGWFATNRPTLTRLLILGVGAIPLVLAVSHPAACAWSAIEVYGIPGVWLLLGRIPTRPPIAGDASPRAVARMLGCVLFTLSLAALATVALPAPEIQGGATAMVMAVGASLTMAMLWRLYLAERTQARVRQRPTVLGMRRQDLLLALMGIVFAAGFLILRVTSRRAETFAVQQLTDEVRTVLAALVEPFTATPAPAAIPLDAPLLRRLLETSPRYTTAALWRVDAETFRIVASAGNPDTVELLRPRAGSETATVRGGTAFVRWRSPRHPTDTLLVMTPAPMDPGASPALFLSVDVEAGGLAEVIVAQRLQTLAIVGLAALITAISVLTSTRAVNETELRALNLRAELENEARNQLLAMVSHEVRTPLQSVLGYADLAAADALPPAAARHVRAIRHQGAALLRIVQDILDLSALRSGRLQLQPEPVALDDLAAELRQAVAERARRKGLAYSVMIDPAAPAAVVVDRVRLAQVLLNLVGNAVKFTSTGSVRLVIKPAEDGAEADRAALEFRVEDTGPGIPPAQLRRIFEPFRRGQDHTSLDAGIGLGLAICEQIVATLQGCIRVESVVGQGSTFSVTLTLATTSPPGGAASAIARRHDAAPLPDGHALAGLRMLIVDDHPYVRDLMRDFLLGLGAIIALSEDGASALNTAAAFRPDVILLDLRLPDRSTAAVLEGLRADAVSAVDPWIVGMSAGATEAHIQQALAGGMNDFLIKPVSLPGLVETLRLSPVGVRIKSPATGDTSSRPADPRAPSPADRSSLLAEAASAIVRIAHACHVGDAPRAVAEAHYLANSCTVLDLAAARNICRAIENAAAREDLTVARALLDDLRGAIARAHASTSAVPGS